MAEGIRVPVLQSSTLAEEGSSSAVQLVEEAEDIHVPELPESLSAEVVEASTRVPAPPLAVLVVGCNRVEVPSAEVVEGTHVLVPPPAELPAEDMTAVEVLEWCAGAEEEEGNLNPVERRMLPVEDMKSEVEWAEGNSGSEELESYCLKHPE